MKLPYQALTDVGKLGGVLESGDLEGSISPLIVHIKDLPFPFRDALGTTLGTTVLRESFIIAAGNDIPASTGAQTLTKATLGKGLWRFHIDMVMDADFNTPSPIVQTGTANVQFQSPAGQSAAILKRWPQTLVEQTAIADLTMLFVDDGWLINLGIPPTGVGQTLSIFLGITGIRLL